MLYPLKLQPSFKDYLWGGVRLREDFKKETNIFPVAESWELSSHRDGLSIITNGKFQGKNFKEYLNILGAGVIGSKNTKADFPLLIKFIDAKENLSLQVHPDDDYAKKHEASKGKTEMWYIVDATEDAKLIYGLKEEITKEEFESRINNNTILEVCNEVKVKKGDVFYIEAGTLHAIGAGCLIAEIQQNSNCTYRVYDYDRVGKDGKKRELHIAKALDVTNLKPIVKDTNKGYTMDFFADYKVDNLVHSPLFNVDKFTLMGEVKLLADEKSFHSILALEGEMDIIFEEEKIQVKKGDSIFVPANMGEYILKGKGEFLFTHL